MADKPFDGQKVAREVLQFAQDAVGDIASDMLSMSSGFLDDEWKRRIAAARQSGVPDLTGWLADELYNDPDTMSDLLGDRIYDATGGDEAKFALVLDALAEGRRAHPALAQAVEDLRAP
jgi:hypothetical protein